MTKYIIASSKDWFTRHPKSDEFKDLNVFNIDKKEELNLDFIESINPRYIFFPHWSWKVPPEIYERFECVAFHTAPLPYGRGGSPIQNLIIHGITTSPVCALRMTDVLDGGGIYNSLEVSLDGTVEEIFSRIADCVQKLILFICKNNPLPIEQTGKVVMFNRLSIADNELLGSYTINEIYDRVRMVDGLDYPRAYIHLGKHRLEFSEAKFYNNDLIMKVKIAKVN
jgi:methionyl-tRNA formyltransferase